MPSTQDLIASLEAKHAENTETLKQYDDLVQEQARIEAALIELRPKSKRGRPKNT